MPLGIDPKVDFAFKLMLGSPEHPAVTIHFLNAFLRLQVPVVDVEIVNPIQDKDRSEGKIVVLDILAEDQLGRCLNVEMQTTLPAGLPERLLYYNCVNYVRQIGKGDRYVDLNPAISICVLDAVLFGQDVHYHHRFRLRCDKTDLVLTEDFEFHTLELPKFAPSSDNIGKLPAEEKWLYLLRNAALMETDQLSDLLAEPPYREALGVLEMISKNPEDLQFYESRLKFLRDEEAKLDAATAKGRKEGREEGKLTGQVQTLQEILGEPITPDTDLSTMPTHALTTLVEELQQKLRNRNA